MCNRKYVEGNLINNEKIVVENNRGSRVREKQSRNCTRVRNIRVMVREWRNQLHMLFNGELKMTAKGASMGRYKPKYPKLDQRLADWFSDQRSQGTIKNCFVYNLR